MQIESVYNENSVILYGKHKFKTLKNVPSEYFLNILKNKNVSDKLLLIYISENLEKIELSLNHKELKTDLCRKISLDKDSANKMIKEISKINQKHKKPIRAYLCPNCNLWHLTSKNQ